MIKPDKYSEIKELIRKIFDENKGRYGYRRITKELRKTHKINQAQPPKSLKLENRDKKVYSNNGDENVDNSRRI